MEIWQHEVEYLALALAWADKAPDNSDRGILGFYVSKIELKDADGNPYGYLHNPDGIGWSFVTHQLEKNDEA